MELLQLDDQTVSLYKDNINIYNPVPDSSHIKKWEATHLCTFYDQSEKG